MNRVQEFPDLSLQIRNRAKWDRKSRNNESQVLQHLKLHLAALKMKYTTMIITMAVVAASMFTSHSFAQSSGDTTQIRRDKKDSAEMVTLREEQAQSTKDRNRMADAKLDRKQTKAKAEDAQRIEKDANDAARESRYALRAERRAQKSRKQADKQADKAAEARVKSNNN